MDYIIDQRKHYPRIDNACKAYTASLRQLLENNHYLLQKHGKSLLGQFRELRNHGIRLDKTTYYEIKREKYLSRNIFLPYYIADYWGRSVKEMMFEDLRRMDEIRRNVFGYKTTEKRVFIYF